MKLNSQRKYFNYGVKELEEEYENARKDLNVGVLEELEEELSYRKTSKARALMQKVQEALNTKAGKPESPTIEDTQVDTSQIQSSPQSPSDAMMNSEPPNNPEQNEPTINWATAFKNLPENFSVGETAKDVPPTNYPLDILETWTSIEVFSPQTYRWPKDLKGTEPVAYIKDGEPWFKNEKSRQGCNLYYIIYLGAIKLDQATQKLISIFQDNRIERPELKGKASIGAILVDRQGIPIPETGIALSSFGWAYGRALNGDINQIKRWVFAEKMLLEQAATFIYRHDEDGKAIPLAIPQVMKLYKWLTGVCQIPENDLEEPSFIIRLNQSYSKGEPETPLLNSFFLSDLQWASSAVKNGAINQALSQYLQITPPPNQKNVLSDKLIIEDVLQPKHTPLGRWPSKGRFPLVLLQQAAVNLVNRELPDKGLLSINGPPGTGKTTLLRDIVASNVVNRALALSEYKDAGDAFSPECQIKIGKGYIYLYSLSEKIRGFEMLVASSNNKAVENISKELPRSSQIADDLSSFSYFKTISDALSDDNEQTWGLVAAVLGNSKNRGEFINKAWWRGKEESNERGFKKGGFKEGGLKTYFESISGKLSHDPEEYKDGKVPQIIKECNAPIDSEEAFQRWQQRRLEFQNCYKKAKEYNNLAQKAYESQKMVAGLKEKIETIDSNIRKKALLVDELFQKLERATRSRNSSISELNQARQNVTQFEMSRPGFFSRHFQRAKWRLWNHQYKELYQITSEKNNIFRETNITFNHSKEKHKTAENELNTLISEKREVEKRYQQAIHNIQAAAHICKDKLVTHYLWSLSHEEQQLFTPNFLAQAQRIRDDLFVSAMELHKAFIDAADKQFRQNLCAFFYILGNGSLPLGKRGMTPQLWSTAFLLTPVISTTFASVGRMLSDMPCESLGWLLIDEAGQAVPQAAIGAVLRAKRVVVVGDPMQVEPVVTLPLPLIESISNHYKVDPYWWNAPDASVQTLSDNVNPFGTSISRDLEPLWIGMPLLVHRRCENPMFKISNRLAYNGQMVSATVAKESNLTPLFGHCIWFDISGTPKEKWCPEEGEFVAKMICKAAQVLGDKLDLFIITPFKIVELSMRERMKKETILLKQSGIENPDEWIYNNIGTIHTFQGKESQGVVLLLGATSPTQERARNWATSNVNLLNVAVSRAKQNFYVVGNYNLWSNTGNMKTISQYLEKRTVTIQNTLSTEDPLS